MWHVHMAISVTKWCTVAYFEISIKKCALWDMWLVHCGICEMGLFMFFIIFTKYMLLWMWTQLEYEISFKEKWPCHIVLNQQRHKHYIWKFYYSIQGITSEYVVSIIPITFQFWEMEDILLGIFQYYFIWNEWLKLNGILMQEGYIVPFTSIY